MLSRRHMLGSLASLAALSAVPTAFAKSAQTIPQKAFLDNLNELVKIDSKSGHAEGIRAVANILKRRFESIKWTVSLHEFEKWGPGMIITNTPDQSSFDVILCGHLDTVQPVGYAAKYPLKVTGDRAHGAGVGDDKASLNALWWMCKDLPESTTKNLKICVLLSPAEEVGPEEVNEWLLDYGKRGKLALVYEPGRPDGSFVKERKGCAWFKVEFDGVPAHAGNNPEDGRNAINAMSVAIPQIVALSKDYERMTINSGVVSGGTVPNTVAAHAEVTFDMRMINSEHTTDVLKRIRAMAEKGFAEGVKSKVVVISDGAPMAVLPETDKLIKIVEKAASNLGQTKPNWLSVGGASDGNALSKAGIPVVDAMGVCAGDLHNPDKEYIELKTITPRVTLGKEVLAILAKQGF